MRCCRDIRLSPPIGALLPLLPSIDFVTLWKSETSSPHAGAFSYIYSFLVSSCHLACVSGAVERPIPQHMKALKHMCCLVFEFNTIA